MTAWSQNRTPVTVVRDTYSTTVITTTPSICVPMLLPPPPLYECHCYHHQPFYMCTTAITTTPSICRKLLDCPCAVIERWMTSFPPEKCLMKTWGVAKWFYLCFYHSTETRKLFSFLRSSQMFLTSSMSLYFYTKWKWRQQCLHTLRENEACPIKACVGRVLFYRCICVYVYMYICIYVYTYICTHVYMYIYIYVIFKNRAGVLYRI